MISIARRGAVESAIGSQGDFAGLIRQEQRRARAVGVQDPREPGWHVGRAEAQATGLHRHVMPGGESFPRNQRYLHPCRFIAAGVFASYARREITAQQEGQIALVRHEANLIDQ